MPIVVDRLVVDRGGLTRGAVGGAGAVARARVALSATLGGGVGDLGGGLDEDISLGVLALAADIAISDSLGVLHIS